MIHWCGEETNMVVGAIPFLGIMVAMFRRRFVSIKQWFDKK